MASTGLSIKKTSKFGVLDIGSCQAVKQSSTKFRVIDHEAGNACLEKLSELGLDYTLYEHEEVPTVELMVEVLEGIGARLTKNLLLKDKKSGSIFLVTTTPERKVDLKALNKMLGLKENANLRFTDCEAVLAVTKGAVSPYAVINDKENVVQMAIDAALVNSSLVCTHPLRCDRSLSLDPKAMLKYLEATGHPAKILDFSDNETTPPSANATKTKKQEPKQAPKKSATKPQQQQQQQQTQASNRNKKGNKETLECILAKKEDDFAGWFAEVITKSEMIEYGKVSGCYILRPWSFGIWEQIQAWFDRRIKEDADVQNCYFPLFVTKGALEAEENHVEGFAPEVAWVTRSGDTEMSEPIAVRPTSETIMYPEFAKWLRSHRDLPLKLNQWCSVVRWEFKYPTPFLRSREFLWQEGHTAHASIEEADEMVSQILELYRRVYEELLAVPVIPGTKTEKEKFAGGHRTTTVEAYVAGSGRAIQGATSHNLGQNFGKIYNIEVEDMQAGKKSIPWQTSWGLTTRSIGVAVMVHGDNQGLVLPPRVAPLQVVIIPLVYKTCTMEQLTPFVQLVNTKIKSTQHRSKVDDRSNYSPGWKYNHWEQKGVPIRIEVGPRDLEAQQVVAVRRVDGNKTIIPLDEITTKIPQLLSEAHDIMLAKASAARDTKLVQVTEWKDFVPALDDNCLVLTPWCDPADQDAEEQVKDLSRTEALQKAGVDQEDVRTATSVAAKTLCIPHKQPTQLPDGTTKCFFTGREATCWCLWGRSY